MNPKDLIEAYQNLEWDGITPRRSDDFSTEVIVNQEFGFLEYIFRVDKYSEVQDPNGIAYTSYINATPWWKDEANTYDVTTTSDFGYTDSIGRLNQALYDAGDSYTQRDAWAIAYVDVPWDKQESLLAVQTAGETYGDGYHPVSFLKHELYAQRTSDGLYCLTDRGLELWRGKYLRQSWKMKITDDSYMLLDHYGHNYVYTDGKLYEFFDDGTTKVIIDHIISTNLHYRNECACFTLQNNNLHFCYISRNNEIVEAEIAKDVAAADLSDDDMVLYQGTDGNVYAIYNFPASDAGMLVMYWTDCYDVACLGKGTIEGYKALYDEYRTKHDNNWLQEQFIEETAGIVREPETTDDNNVNGATDDGLNTDAATVNAAV